MAVEVVWMATEDSGQLPPEMLTSTLDEMRAHVRRLRARGEGYLAVTRPGGRFPALFVGFRGEHAVVHLDPDDEHLFLLHGDGSVPDEVKVTVPIMEDTSTFTGYVAMTVDHAMELVEEFAHTGSVGDHPRSLL